MSKQSSEAFHRLDAQQSVLISRDGDDAYLSSELDAIIAGLNGVPDDALEKDRAVALAGKLRAEQRRVREERAAQEKAEAPSPPEPARPLRDLSPAEPVAVHLVQHPSRSIASINAGSVKWKNSPLNF